MIHEKEVASKTEELVRMKNKISEMEAYLNGESTDLPTDELDEVKKWSLAIERKVEL